MFRCFLMALLVLALIPAVHKTASGEGRTFYVSTSGNDRNPGTGEAPFRTLARGVRALTAGATLYVMQGTYTESLFNTIPGGVSWDLPVTVSAYPGHTVIVKPPRGAYRVLHFQGADRKYIIVNGLILDGQNVSEDVVKITHGGRDLDTSAHHIRIINGEVRNAPGNGILVTGTGHANSNEFINLKVYDNGKSDFEHGVYISTDNNLVERCEIFRNGGWGVHLYNSAGSTNGNIIRNNKIYKNARAGERGTGIGIYSGSHNVAYNNVLWGQQIGVVLNWGANSSAVVNNTIYGHTLYGIYNGPASRDALLQNNIIYKNAMYDVLNRGVRSVVGYNLVGQDPKFKDAAAFDFHLHLTSPAIAAGTRVSFVETDFNGAPRPAERPYSIGAFEAE